MIKTIGAILLFVVIFLASLGVGGAILIMLAYGLGLLVSGLIHFEPFQATILALAAILVAGILVERSLSGLATLNSYQSRSGIDDEEYEEDDEIDEDDGEDEDEEEELFINPGIPRWRQPLKQSNFSDVKPDARCPCGSGRKFKSCHGAKQGKTSAG